MSEVDEANARLRAALDRLEAALGARAADGGSVPRAEFDLLMAEYEALKSSSATVAVRLDATIGRLKSLLDG